MRLYNLPLPQCRFAANVSTIILVFLAIVVSLVHAADPPQTSSVVADNQTAAGLIVSDSSPHIQLALGSHNGLELHKSPDDDADVLDLDVVRRAPQGTSLSNNEFQQSTIELGETQWWYFPKEQVHGPRSNYTSNTPANLTEDGLSSTQNNDGGGNNSVFITLTTCKKPGLKNNSPDVSNVPVLPQLELHVSQSSQPGAGPGSDSISGISDEGYLKMVMNADDDVHIGVTAPNSTDYSGSYDYHIAVSVDAYFHRLETEVSLFFLDADVDSALFTTANLTQASSDMPNYDEWMNFKPPYMIFLNNMNDFSIAGIRQSYCALAQNAQVGKNGSNVETEMTSRGLGHKPKEQFFVKGLNGSSSYLAFLAEEGISSASGNGVVRGGGRVFQPTNFTTKSDGNCNIIYGLSFCSEVAYAVPSNPSINETQLQTMYDEYAQSMFANFTYSLQQIQCEAGSENMYSLSVNCTNCSESYKEWLCSMVIPRCEDYSSSNDFLQPRNAGQEFFNGTSLDENHPDRNFPPSNQSRSKMIDEDIRPGPYKEVLPCEDVCHNLARTCPTKLDFSCPQGSLLNISYGRRVENGYVTCNYMGAAYYLNAACGVYDRLWFALYALGVFWVLSWMHV